MIPRKQNSDQADWVDAARLAYEQPDLERAERLVVTAAEQVRRRCDGYPSAYCWSGGKDSQALRIIAERAGVTNCLLVLSELEFPEFLAWCTDNMPWGLTVHVRPLDLQWLISHQELIFPQDAATGMKWFRLVQHTGQRSYCRERGTEILLMGRRRADGNFVGRQSNEYRDRGGFVRYSPIADWSHEDVLCVLGAYATPLPPIYRWPRGFRVGTGPWPARQWCRDRAHGWQEVTTIDRTVTELAASHGLKGAAEALRLCAV